MQPVTRHLPLAIALLLGAATCVTEPDGTNPMGCQGDDECASGQECREGACYDKNTRATFAAELFAPETQTEMLPRAELEELVISGNEATVMFVGSVLVEGRIVLRVDDELSVAAKVTFSRKSRIDGAPDYVVTTKALGGRRAGEVAFRTRLVPTVGDETYTVTIVPDDGTITPAQPGQPLPNALAPPTQLTRQTFTTQRYLPITLDAGGLRAISGQVVDAVGVGLGGMSVKAYSRRTTGAPYELISSTGTTDSYGNFTIYVPLGRSSLFDLHVAPGPGQNRASLVRTNVSATATTAATGTTDAIKYPALPTATTYSIPVEGPSAAGGTRRAIGARVLLSTTLASGRDTVTYSTEAMVNLDGLAVVQLIPGVLASNRTYDAVVLPSPTSDLGARWDGKVMAGPSPGVLQTLTLAPRVPVSGKVVDAMGRAAVGITVKPVLSRAFVAGASAATQALVDRVQLAEQLPEVTTSGTGTFSLYLDPMVGTQAAAYDLELLPPNGSPLPRWSADEIAVGGEKVDVPQVRLPNATLVSGIVKTDDGKTPVADVVVQVYMRSPDGVSARPRAIATSDERGKISLVLPAPE